MGYLDNQFDGFRRENSIKVIEDLSSETRFPPKETVNECLEKVLFPSLKTLKKKGLFLVYMVKCLLHSYTRRRKCEDRDDFRNKRLEMPGELLFHYIKLQNHNSVILKEQLKSVMLIIYPA